MPLLTVSSVGPRRYFPAWIDSDSGVSALQLGAGIVLPRVRAALPLRRVIISAATTLNRQLSDARRLR
jgi:hypothetical protein